VDAGAEEDGDDTAIDEEDDVLSEEEMADDTKVDETDAVMVSWGPLASRRPTCGGG
jgi:hypothetical protein